MVVGMFVTVQMLISSKGRVLQLNFLNRLYLQTLKFLLVITLMLGKRYILGIFYSPICRCIGFVRVITWYYAGLTPVLRRYHPGITPVLRRYFSVITPVLRRYYAGIAPVLRQYYAGIALGHTLGAGESTGETTEQANSYLALV